MQKIDVTAVFNKGSRMNICLGKSCSSGLLCMFLVNVCQSLFLLLPHLILRVGCRIRLH